MTTHDPRKLLESLRNHLTLPEANVSFLLGAGTSCAVRVAVAPNPAADEDQSPKTRSLIPNVAELTAICAREIKKLDPVNEATRFGAAYDAIEKELNTGKRPVNIEDILSCVRRKVHAIGTGDTLLVTSSEMGRYRRHGRMRLDRRSSPRPHRKQQHLLDLDLTKKRTKPSLRAPVRIRHGWGDQHLLASGEDLAAVMAALRWRSLRMPLAHNCNLPRSNVLLGGKGQIR